MNSLSGQKVVVIGGNGTLGSAAAEAAVAAGATVAILSRRASSIKGATAFQGSITDPEALSEVLQGAIGVVISVDANRNPQQLNQVFVDGTRNVLQVSSSEAQIIFMSHIGITDIERMPDYNRAKLEAEKIIRASGKPYTIIRPSWVVPGHHGVKLEQGDRYTGRRDDIGHADLGLAIVAAFEDPEARGKTFELYGGGNTTPNWHNAFAQLVKDQTV